MITRRDWLLKAQMADSPDVADQCRERAQEAAEKEVCGLRRYDDEKTFLNVSDLACTNFVVRK